jgi:hypothetical protein
MQGDGRWSRKTLHTSARPAAALDIARWLPTWIAESEHPIGWPRPLSHRGAQKSAGVLAPGMDESEATLGEGHRLARDSWSGRV